MGLGYCPLSLCHSQDGRMGSVLALQIQRKLTLTLEEWISEGNGGCYPSELSQHLSKVVGRISMRESAVLSTVCCIYYDNAYVLCYTVLLEDDKLVVVRKTVLMFIHIL
jgi:hypothetical protein